MRSKATEARIAAYECLSHIRRHDSFASEVVSSRIADSKMPRRERAFATRLVMGAVSFKGTLDYVLDGCMSSPNDVKPDIRDALRISTYEILYLRKDPHAAVSQGVELARHVNDRASRLANAVLRKVVAASRSFPFGDPEKDLKAKSLLNGFPTWMTALICSELGEEHANEMLSSSDVPAPIYIAVNSLKECFEQAESKLGRDGIRIGSAEVNGHAVPGCLKLANRDDLGSSATQEMLASGKCVISDAAAQLIADMAIDAVLASAEARSIERDELSCLELCAGRGTKTVLLQSDFHRKTSSRFKRYAIADSFESKLAMTMERAKSCDLRVDEQICADLSQPTPQIAGRAFDLVFLDAPCSCLGTFRRHPEVRWRVTEDSIAEHGELASKMLENAAAHVADGGILAYSTCTITNAENESVVAGFLKSEAGQRFSIVPIDGDPCLRTYVTPDGCDAHFCTVLVADNRII